MCSATPPPCTTRACARHCASTRRSGSNVTHAKFARSATCWCSPSAVRPCTAGWSSAGDTDAALLQGPRDRARALRFGSLAAAGRRGVPMDVVVRPHLLSDRDLLRLDMPPGTSIAEMVAAYPWPAGMSDQVCALINGVPVPQQHWRYVRPKPGPRSCSALHLQGGRRGKTILALVATIVISIDAPGLGLAASSFLFAARCDQCRHGRLRSSARHRDGRCTGHLFDLQAAADQARGVRQERDV